MNRLTLTIHVIVSGCVQGIGYRKWMKQRALRAGVAGWIKNREDGAVEAVFQGETKHVGQVMHDARTGPFLANITTVETKEMPYDANMVDFVVIQ